ncbi:MAG: hypothetical protein NWS53_12780 [Salibacteraceae bacterium]|nr:hypothetical protein [Salibacteraceae bacterium]
MPRIFISLLVLFMFSNLAQSQTIAVYGGANYGRYYSFKQEEGHFSKNFNPQMGYGFGVELKDLMIDSTKLARLAISFQNYGGDFLIQDGGLAGSSSTSGEVTRNALFVDFYPVGLKLLKELEMSFGASFGVLLNYQLSGKKYGYSAGNSWSNELSTNSNFVKPLNFGLNAALGYEFKIGSIRLEPRYNFFLGLANEFDQSFIPTKSMRHSFQLSIGRAWK